ncbi:CHAT domain-containing protein [Acrocarpospora sp. B8E8]|uniref:CHAT domain-containing protein n=1 Tax=Acrocarpospora sp. B8E8 TaxID=3153572 RepID=UPI00325F3808
MGRAIRAVELAGRDPRWAREEAEGVLRESERVGDAEAASIALRGMALAAWELGDLGLADELLTRAVRRAVDVPVRAAQAAMSQVPFRALLGDPEGALALADKVEADLDGLDRHRLDVQRAVPLVLLGRHMEAVERCTTAFPALGDDPRCHAGGLLSRGLAYVFLERFGEAAADFTLSAEIARSSGFTHLAMLAEGNLPFAAARRGDIPAAFASYQTAEHSLVGYPERLAAMRVDFAQALVEARLPNEARALLEQAVPVLAASNAQVALSDARLLLAQVELLTGDPYQAQQTAQTAHTELLTQGRARWAPLATEIILRARLAQSDPPHLVSADLLTDLYACSDELATTGWLTQADSLRLLAGRTAKHLKDRAAATTQLSRLLTPRTRPIVRHHAQAVLHHLNGDDTAAMTSVEAGIATFLETISPTSAQGIDHPMIMGAAEIRAHAIRGAEQLAAFGLELALSRGTGQGVLAWAERWRAVVRGDFNGDAPTIGPTCLVEFVRHEDDLFAVVAQHDNCELHKIGSYSDVTEATIRIRYQLRRRNLRDTEPSTGPDTEPDTEPRTEPGTGRDTEPRTEPGTGRDTEPRTEPGTGRDTEPGTEPGTGRDTGCDTESGIGRDIGPGAESMPDAELTALDALLMRPFHLNPGPITIVPTGSLHTLPWPLLPSLRGRPVSIHSHAGGPPAAHKTDTLVIAVAGPELEYAQDEVQRVVKSHKNATTIPATKKSVIEALESAGVLHIAAHGMFSPRSPMLSNITLDDGPLMAYELLRANRVPPVVVLSACEAGMAHAPMDGVAWGLAGAFLERGARCVIAGVVPVRDEEALILMDRFHELLASGHPPAEALAKATHETNVPGFACFGSGD